MKKVEVNQAKPYEAARHFGCTTHRLHGKEESGASKFSVGWSVFLPGGGAEYSASPTEKVYMCLDGEITIKNQEETAVLKPMDSVFIGANEGREILNASNFPATMLVIINYPS